MSASLVGSEMCIRDSPRARRRWSAKAKQVDARDFIIRYIDTRGCTCLLYTSDAADDMQCV
eukprot:7628755-Alexandrium_andersonii.AAC.1